jgi:hypothetical protein
MTYNTVATFPGRAIIWNRVINSGGAIPKNIQWGTLQSLLNVTGSASANVNLFAPTTEARTGGATSILTTSQLGDTAQIAGTITCLSAAKTIAEAGLFDAASPVSPTTTVTASLTASATTMTLGTSLAGAAGNYYAQIGNETVLVSGAASTTLTIMTRGALGTTPAIQAAGTPITMGGDGGAGGATNSAQTVNAASITASWGGNLFIHADFAPISLNINDSISFTFSDTLT